VPEDIFESFTPQKYLTKEGKVYKHVPSALKNVIQFVLEIKF